VEIEKKKKETEAIEQKKKETAQAEDASKKRTLSTAAESNDADKKRKLTADDDTAGSVERIKKKARRYIELWAEMAKYKAIEEFKTNRLAEVYIEVIVNTAQDALWKDGVCLYDDLFHGKVSLDAESGVVTVNGVRYRHILVPDEEQKEDDQDEEQEEEQEEDQEQQAAE
jgi:parvulin-like peptidyl-prolyl isomerase